MEKSEHSVKMAVRAGDILRVRQTGREFVVARCDGLRAFPLGASQTFFLISSCDMVRPASDALHTEVLAILCSAVGISGEVTPERMQRGDIVLAEIEDRRGLITEHMRSLGALYILRKSGAIQDRHVAAAEMWLRDYETGILGARDPRAGKSGRKSDIEYAMLSRAAAVSRCLAVQRSLGKASMQFLKLFMIDCLSVSQISGMINKDRKKISGAIELLLEQLVELYDSFPGRIMAR
ncbi:hypothetical protein [Acetobacter senegalensis]|uniref:hypothetical protein n=1 Tax=Acetobacter senegalensis TaxID=446692 RepID=UPI00264E726C|nr:hypothetical protein [Acetobacter senegalensis]MDN7350544.1 hypothetical protein [Acetobacter senegalensis]